MEEFMLHRRYSKFKNRKIKRRFRMSNECDDAVKFKVKRFIKDIEKYSVLKEKKKARKEAKLLENNLNNAANKGIYKSAVFSHSSIKALLSGSSVARLEGDLMSLSNRKPTLEKKNINRNNCESNNNNKKSKEINDERNDHNDENSIIGNQLLSSVIFERNSNDENDNLADKETRSVYNENADAEIVEIQSNDFNNIHNNRNSEDIVENNGFIADSPPIVDNLRNMSQNGSDEILFPKAPSVNGEEFFDLLNTPPKNRNSQTFNLFNSPENNQWTEDLIHAKKNNANSCNSIGVQTSLEPIKLPEEYIFKFQPDNNLINNEKLLKKDKQIEVNLDDFDLTFNRFDRKQNYHPRIYKNNENYKFNGKFIENYYLNSPEILKNRKIIHSPIMKDFHRKNYPLNNFSSSSFIDSINIEKTLRNHDFSLNDTGKFNKENFDFNQPKFSKYLPQMCSKDDYNFKRKIPAKDESNIKRRYPRLLTNSRFKTSLKFSPHKYC
ncbi:hypothetical protein O3M35_002851 [Rhynocoris fuscipes]|uniref:Uncharacterized protein n=1 Tax=Rhynocoris fuscipes TaxID=488301 RepID=A0AAW1CNJ6_9HEMI